MMKIFALIRGYRLTALIAIAALGLAVLSSCTVQQGKSLLSAQTSSGDSVQKVVDSVPFAYDVAVDTISYNSCVGGDLNSSGKLHGIKLGANEGFVDTTGTGAVKGGLKLRSDFLQYLAKNVDPTFPNTSISPSQIQYILQNSPVNKDLKIQYAVRNSSNLKVVLDVIQPSSTEVFVPIRDGIYDGSTLSEDPVVTSITEKVKFGGGTGPAATVLSEGPRVYNVGSKSSPDPLEGSLGYSNAFDFSFPVIANTDDNTGAGEQYSDNVRAQFNSFNYLLAVTFGSESQQSSTDLTPSNGFNSLKRKTETDLKRAFCRGFELGFSSKNSALSSWRKNLLTQVVEKNLEDGRLVAGASWTCDNILIMKTNQLNNKKPSEPACAELIASDLLDTNISARVKNIRRHYSEDQWAVGLFYAANALYNPLTRTVGPTLCLVNKQANCYLP
ncbi:MAG: hypothetical protein AABY53_10025, partial [Bdellovibrionota bacterium]